MWTVDTNCTKVLKGSSPYCMNNTICVEIEYVTGYEYIIPNVSSNPDSCDSSGIYYCADLQKLGKYFNVNLTKNGNFPHENYIKK